MELEKLFLKKEELPILYENCFSIPLHPKLLDEKILIDNKIAKRIFSEVAKDWYEDLVKYVEEENPENREWILNAYLNNEPIITTNYNHQYLGTWEDKILLNENGLVQDLTINRNHGGSIYFNKDDSNCESLIPNQYLKFSEEKTKEFEFSKIGDYSKCFVYTLANVDNYPSALFLRNWAIMYMNEVFKDVF